MGTHVFAPLIEFRHSKANNQLDRRFRTAALPGQSLLQELGVLADLVHQQVVVSLYGQRLLEHAPGHGGGEQRERSVRHQLLKKRHRPRLFNCLSVFFIYTHTHTMIQP